MKKRSDGRYQKKITLSDGRQKHVYGRTPAEVNKKALEALKADEAGIIFGDKTTVGEWTTEWFSTYKQGLREHTLMGYRNAYNNHIYELLADIPLKNVRPTHIQQVMNGVSTYSEDLQRKVLNTMRQIFRTAIQNGLIARDPCEGIKITPHASDERLKTLSPEQQHILLESVVEPRARLFCAIGLYCGLRREEILGLMWSDIDNDELTVNRAITFLANQQDDNHNLKSKAAHRTVPIPPPLVKLLDEYPRNSLYLFRAARGQELTLTSFRRMWAHAQKSVPFRVTPHMLRHSYATSLYRAGIDLKTAQYLLGHADIKMTANIYTHIEKGQIQEAKQILVDFWTTEAQRNIG